MIITAVCQAQTRETEHVAAERGLEHKWIKLLLVCGFHMQMANSGPSNSSVSSICLCLCVIHCESKAYRDTEIKVFI